jgi:hypothetical protein
MDFCQRLFEKCFAVILSNFRFPLQLFKGGTGITIPLFKGATAVFSQGETPAVGCPKGYRAIGFPQVEQMAWI